MSHNDPRSSQFAEEDVDLDGDSPDNVALNESTTGYSDDPETRRGMHFDSPYMPPSRVMSVIKVGCCSLGLVAVLTTGYFMGKSSNRKIDAVMGRIPGSDTFTAARSSPESDFVPAGEMHSSGSESEEERMELLRASIGESSLTLDDVIRENEEWDEDKIPDFASSIDVSGLDDTDRLLFTFLAKYPFARDFVVELVMDDYTAPSYDVGTAEEIYERLDNSLEAMELYQVDYKPVPIERHPFLFVGSVGASLTYGALMKVGITHIVDLDETSKCNVFKEDITYLCMGAFHNNEDSLETLDQAVRFIEHARTKGGKVMSHDWYGTTHSTTLLVAYLMNYEEMPMQDAINLIQKARPIANPYVRVLEQYGTEYLS